MTLTIISGLCHKILLRHLRLGQARYESISKILSNVIHLPAHELDSFFFKEANLVENSEINIVNEYTYVEYFGHEEVPSLEIKSV